MTIPNVAALLEAVAAERPTDPAVLRSDGSVAWTLGGLAEVAARRAGALTARGVGPGDAVLVLARGEAALPVVAGVLWSGAAILVPPRGVGPRAALAAALAIRPRAVIASPALWSLALLEPRLLRVPVRVVAGRKGRRGLDGAAMSPRAVADDDPAAITFTTGTTGQPQPVVRTHGVLHGQHDALDRLRPARAGDIDLAGLPMLVLHDLARGVPVVLPGPNEVMAGTARRLGVATLAGFPPLAMALADSSPAGGYPSLRAVHVGGAPVPTALVRRLRAVAPAATVTIVYGATEAEPIAAIDGAEYVEVNEARVPGDGICVGRPVAGLELRLAGARLEIRGPQVVPSGRDGWRDLGDLARIDADGRVWLLGRASCAVDGVPPVAIEQAAESLVGVRAAAVVPARDRASRPTLALELHARDARLVLARARGLVGAQWPGLDVARVAVMPREARSGKVDLRRLAGLLPA